MLPQCLMTRPDGTSAQRRDLARSVRLFAAFRKEQTDPDFFYRFVARDTIDHLASYVPLDRTVIVDVGGGAGYFAEAMRAGGARVLCVDVDAGEMSARDGAPLAGAVLGSALQLPILTGSVDVCFSTNVLEHVPHPFTMADEMVRITRGGGHVYLAFTNWLSPWGGHETSPWHYLGGRWAVARYERRRGTRPKNLYGESLFRVSVAAAIRWARNHNAVEVIDVLPRYLPSWARPIVAVPGLRELLTWNLVLVLRKQ